MDDPELGRRLSATAQEEARAKHSWNARLAAILSDVPMPLDHAAPMSVST
jgi:hypothetical protein